MGGADQHGQHEQRAEPLDRDSHRGGQQDEQGEPHGARADAERRRRPRRRTRVAESGRWSAASAAPPRTSSSGGRERSASGHAERVAEQQLLEPLRRVGGEREQRAEAHKAGDRDAVPVSGPTRASRAANAISAAATSRAAGGAEQQRSAGQRGEHQAGQQAVRQRLGA